MPYGPWIVGPNGDHGYFFDNNYGLGESYVYNVALNKDPDKLATIFRIMDRVPPSLQGGDEFVERVRCFNAGVDIRFHNRPERWLSVGFQAVLHL